MGEMALYPLRHHKGRAYNIFPREDGKYEGKVFDEYRRVKYQTAPTETPEKAIAISRAVIDLMAKGQCVPGPLAVLVDEGKAIREKEEKEYNDFKKAQRKRARG